MECCLCFIFGHFQLFFLNLNYTNFVKIDRKYFTLFSQANVVCKQLGFSRAVYYTVNSKFGNVSAEFSFDEVDCSGQEETLEDCKHENTDNCGPDEGAGVVCHENSGNECHFNIFTHQIQWFKISIHIWVLYWKKIKVIF